MKNRGIIVISSLVVIGGGVAFLLWKLNKKKEEQKLKDEEAAKAAAASTNTNTGGSGSTGGGGGSTGSGTKPTFTFPFKSEMEGNMFRVYVRFVDKPFADSIKLEATGKLNSTLQKAWDKYGDKYLPTKPKVDNPKVDNPTVPKKGNTLAEVTANLKANGYTVETYTDRIVAIIKDNQLNIQKTYFFVNGTFISLVFPYWYGTSKEHLGFWEDSGNIMRLKVSKRVLSDGIKSNLQTLFDVKNV